ncbi:MAG: TetR family transcriptional regulator C-terminal domain-containing protein [Brevibacterium sp.]|uniref:TetR family transcriptional regulator C-terminal domain-containing protein n=1 Tax=Brevibacterium sp. TaxID=1701 RepID=UPI002647A43A|nr:TetR family transcriptional regulator C-terminal domain-containing protein [Brevibacterium sp.]MDN5806117.1 TetR family transcriptional regulator C-terminal domain-containing protein [Brevibacterium sp.]MDN5832625.1 TetR family transcriptional regulator C-terminal domain-containing protein [Brevibacterium sp.]MDN5875513.1 TetR family transcriptional regulator C-terminal domain-containing protein [Brevibacterium sp.]MDN5908449.1 TetR family transcriptional regulator C-terminal domain-containi
MTDRSEAGGTARRAKDALRASNLSQRQVAASIGIDETKLSKSLTGRRRFGAEEILGLATATGVTVRWLLGDESQVSATPPRFLPGSDQRPGPAPDSSPRRLIVETAWDLFARHGYETVRIADIAEATGLSSASIHYYFEGKSELFEATLDYSVKLAFDRQIAWLDEIRSPRRRLQRLLELQSPIGRTSRSEWSIWLQTWARLGLEDPHASDYPANYERWSQTVRSTIEAGQAEGAFRPGDSEALADELTSLLDGLGVKVLTGIMDVATFRRRLSSYLKRTIVNPDPDEESQ